MSFTDVDKMDDEEFDNFVMNFMPELYKALGIFNKWTIKYAAKDKNGTNEYYQQYDDYLSSLPDDLRQKINNVIAYKDDRYFSLRTKIKKVFMEHSK